MFKKISTLLLALTFVVALAIPARSAPRTFDKTVKTELSTNIVKADFVTINHVSPVFLPQTMRFNPLAISELNRPPGLVLATANYASINRYKNDAFYKMKYNSQRLGVIPVPLIRRTV